MKPLVRFALLVLVVLGSVARADVSIQHWQTSHGANVYFFESRGLPMVDASVEFPAGSARDTQARSGLASLTLRMLRAGSGQWSEEEISRRLANVGANLGDTFDFDRAGYSVRSLSSSAELDQTISTLAAILQQPAFPSAALEREKQRVIAGLREGASKPDVIANRAFARLVYRDHPYGLRPAGEIDAVAALTRDEAIAFYHRYYGASGAVVSVVGDLTRAQAEAIAERLTQGLPDSPPPAALPPVPPLQSAVVSEIEHPAAQAHIFVGAPGMRRLDPDYFRLWVGNYILGGGGFNSRFTEEVREKRGLSYSVYSLFAPYQQNGAFTVGLQTRRDQASAALKVVRDTLERFLSEGPTAQELDGAKQNIIGGFALRIDSNRKILDYLAVIGFYRLPLDYLEQFPKRVSEVTGDQIRDAFRRRIDPQRLATVIVGNGQPSTSERAQE